MEVSFRSKFMPGGTVVLFSYLLAWASGLQALHFCEDGARCCRTALPDCFAFVKCVLCCAHAMGYALWGWWRHIEHAALCMCLRWLQGTRHSAVRHGRGAEGTCCQRRLALAPCFRVWQCRQRCWAPSRVGGRRRWVPVTCFCSCLSSRHPSRVSAYAHALCGVVGSSAFLLPPPPPTLP